jgi:hypothetical protein
MKSRLIKDPEIVETSMSQGPSKNSELPDMSDFIIKNPYQDSRIDSDKIVNEGWVNVRRKLFFYKRRQLILMEDGTVFVMKKN